MRVTQSMLTSNMLRNLSKSYDHLGFYQEQLTTGKKITKPSDNPVIAMNGLYYRSSLKEIEQYKSNINEVHLWMDNSDDVLDKTTLALNRIRELTVQASTDTYQKSQREDMAKEIEQLTDHIKDLFNTQVAGKYIFNGTDTKTPPIQKEGDQISVSDNNQPFNIEVLPGIQIGVNITASQMFPKSVSYKNPDYKEGSTEPQTLDAGQLFDTLNDLKNALTGVDKNGNPVASGKDITKYIAKVDAHLDHVEAKRSELGARLNRVDMIQDRLERQEVSTTQIVSDNEDADMEKVIIDLITQESVQRAALGAGARIMQPSLLDFLK